MVMKLRISTLRKFAMPHPPKTPQMTIKISLLQFIIPPPNTKSVSAKKNAIHWEVDGQIFRDLKNGIFLEIVV